MVMILLRLLEAEEQLQLVLLDEVVLVVLEQQVQ
tara:strand:- start:225 stop:326 length:102 start_codon:yes stop_codon:yes gene_type:complete